MKFIFGFVIAWLVFATFTFDGNDAVTVYSLSPTTGDNANTPKMLSSNPITYAIRGDAMVSSMGSFLYKYDNCIILNIDDWKCEYSDGSGSFGFTDGDYWEVPEHEPTQYVFRIAYVFNKCKWWFAEGDILSALYCLIIPFVV